MTLDEDERFLRLLQTETENEWAISGLLRSLVEQGLDVSAVAPVVSDGAKKLWAGVRNVFGGPVPIPRCQWHKRENVVAHLPWADQEHWRRKLQRAYQRPTYKEATRDLKKIRSELEELNQSAVASLDEGFEETLTLHNEPTA